MIVTTRPVLDAAVRENRAAWLAALRSGNYRQARRALRRHDRFCCLGVAEDVLDCDWSPISVLGDPATHAAVHPARVGRDSSLTSLTRTARVRLGLVGVSVAAWNHGINAWVDTTLVQLNDVWRLDFKTIAAVIVDQGDDWVGDRYAARQLAARWRAEARPRPSWAS